MFGLGNIINFFSGWFRSDSASVSDSDSTLQEGGQVGRTLASLPRLFRILLAAVFILWVLGFIEKFIFFKHYLPSHAWLQVIEPYATIFGTTVALVCTLCAFLGFKDEERRTGKHRDGFVLACKLLFGAFLFYIPTVDLVRRGVPAMIAVALGDRVEHPYVVEDVEKFGSKGCRRSINLRNMPMMTSLCSMPSEFRAQMHPGMSVIFIGKGTWMGLFVEDFRKP
ncbi:MAG: hypothetical protein JNK34_07240 [Tabrizicola sp.]|nr:hypothetical protein [Tabrizicola sp.]